MSPDERGGLPTPAPLAPASRSPFAIGLDPGSLLPILVWSGSTALGVVLFGAVVRRQRRDDPEAAVAMALAAETMAAAAAPPAPTLTGSTLVPPPPIWKSPTAREPVRFDSGPQPGVERRTITYRFVKISDGPDDLRSHEIGRLDRGDEVEVVGEYEGMLQVRTPSGMVGWVPRVVIVG